jgi:hypothetical protein
MYHGRRNIGGNAFAQIDWTWIDAGQVRCGVNYFLKKPTTLRMSVVSKMHFSYPCLATSCLETSCLVAQLNGPGSRRVGVQWEARDGILGAAFDASPQEATFLRTVGAGTKNEDECYRGIETTQCFSRSHGNSVCDSGLGFFVHSVRSYT